MTLLLMWLSCGCVSGSSELTPVSGTAATLPESSKPYAFVNGRWFDGKGFVSATWYSERGHLTRSPPQGQVEIVDLSGLFFVPPFGEAHNHNVEGSWNLETTIDRYLKDGVFYVKIPNNVREFAVANRGVLNLPTSIDVIFAHVGLTGKGGHPIALYEDLLRVAVTNKPSDRSNEDGLRIEPTS